MAVFFEEPGSTGSYKLLRRLLLLGFRPFGCALPPAVNPRVQTDSFHLACNPLDKTNTGPLAFHLALPLMVEGDSAGLCTLVFQRWRCLIDTFALPFIFPSLWLRFRLLRRLCLWIDWCCLCPEDVQCQQLAMLCFLFCRPLRFELIPCLHPLSLQSTLL